MASPAEHDDIRGETSGLIEDGGHWPFVDDDRLRIGPAA
jgi:hypothetical protein